LVASYFGFRTTALDARGEVAVAFGAAIGSPGSKIQTCTRCPILWTTPARRKPPRTTSEE
jgi:hypothetical protein